VTQRPQHVAETKQFYATKPTRTTVFLRTFIPWQLWRFAVINLRMISMIRLSHRTRHGRQDGVTKPGD
jgi:hypothetical protein